MSTTIEPASNGQTPEPDADPDVATGPLAALRDRPVNLHILRGYGPLVVGVVLFVLMVVLAPTVAPERVVERPVTEPTAVAEP